MNECWKPRRRPVRIRPSRVVIENRWKGLEREAFGGHECRPVVMCTCPCHTTPGYFHIASCCGWQRSMEEGR